MNFSNLEKILSNQPKFRLEQAKQAVFVNLIEDWSQATTLPPELRQILNQECPLKINAEFFISDDKNTIKALMTLEDGLKIEAVLMRYENGRNTVCVSSQVGCPLNCLFCATGKNGFKRNLETSEIIEQVLLFARLLKNSQIFLPSLVEEGNKRGGVDPEFNTPPNPSPQLRGGKGQRVNNIVFMGMGEPFLNYENVMAAIRILNDQKGLAIGARHISISTIGIAGGIDKLTEEKIQVNLAISLHAPNNELRSRVVPANKNYPIEKILQDVNAYLKKTSRKVMFEYVMIKELNDAPAQAKELVSLVKKIKNGPYMINLISYNPTGIFDPSPPKTINAFKDILYKEGIETTERFRFGRGIKAACGQLAFMHKAINILHSLKP